MMGYKCPYCGLERIFDPSEIKLVPLGLYTIPVTCSRCNKIFDLYIETTIKFNGLVRENE